MAELKIQIGASIDGLKQSLSQAESQLQTFSKNAIATGKTLSLAITAPLTGFAGFALKTFADFESSLNKVKAITNATGDEFEALSAKARELGATTQFSASQAADAINFLGIAGFSTDKILGSLDDTLKLSAASGLDLGRSADIVSNVLTGFRLETDELGRAVDVLSKSFTSSNTDLNQLADALKFAAPVASSFGVSIEESVAAIGALSDAGLQGSLAGTGLRRVLSTLGKDADKLGISTTTAEGKLRNFADIIEDIEKRGLTASEALTIFGDRGGPAILTLLETGSKALREYTSELENSGGTAQRLADVQLQGLAGSLKTLRSSFEELQLRLSESGLARAFERIVDLTTDLIRKFSNLSDRTLSIITVIAGVAAAIGPLLIAVGSIIKFIPILTAGLASIKVAFLALTGPIGLIAVAVAATAFAVIQNWDAIKKTFEDSGLKDIIIELLDNIKELAFVLASNFKKSFLSAKDSVVEFLDIIKPLTNFLRDQLIKQVKFLAEVVSQAFGFIADLIKGDFSTAFLRLEIILLSVFKRITEAIQPLLEFIGLGNKLDGVLNKIDSTIANNKAIIAGRDAYKNYKEEVVETTEEVEKLASAISSLPVAGLGGGGRTQETAIGGGEDRNPLAAGLPIITPQGQVEATNTLQSFYDESGEIIEQGNSSIVDQFAQLNTSLSQILEEGLGNTLGDVSFAIGDALASGANVVESAGSALLNGLAGILNQLGQLAIGAGLTIEAIRKSLSSLQGIGAIAAGVALVALAGIVSSAARGLAGGFGSGGGGSVGGSGGGGSGQTISGTGLGLSDPNREIRLVAETDGNKLKYIIDQSQFYSN